jgi:hypothetical protein
VLRSIAPGRHAPAAQLRPWSESLNLALGGRQLGLGAVGLAAEIVPDARAVLPLWTERGSGQTLGDALALGNPSGRRWPGFSGA